jgi:hypothetical protein
MEKTGCPKEYVSWNKDVKPALNEDEDIRCNHSSLVFIDLIK